MEQPTRKRKRHPKGHTPPSDMELLVEALKAENLKLHREIAKLKAKHISDWNRSIAENEDPVRDAEAEAVLKEVDKMLQEGAEQNLPEGNTVNGPKSG